MTNTKRDTSLPSKGEQKALGKVLWLLAEEYDLSISELALLLDVGEKTIRNAKKARSFPQPSLDRMRRIGHLLGIKKNLEILFPRNQEIRANWLKVPRETFKGKSALELIEENPLLSMDRLFTVRRILDMYRVGTLSEVI
ncbi:MAG: hypothetical protein ACOH5I_14860 [Oligoflexus sp.]